MQNLEEFHQQMFSKYRTELARTPACVEFVTSDWCIRPRTVQSDAMVYSMFLDEFVREIFNSLNGLINITRRITAWSRALVGLSEEERIELVHETIDSVATTALNAPYAIRSRFYFAVAHLSHQANKFTMEDLWVDDLRLDGEIIKQDAHDKAKGWSNWRKLNSKLDLVAGNKFKTATDDFRNKYNHRFSPHFELGLSETVKRIPSHALPTAVQEAMGVQGISKSDSSRFIYAFGGTPPLKIDDLVRALEDECRAFTGC